MAEGFAMKEKQKFLVPTQVHTISYFISFSWNSP